MNHLTDRELQSYIGGQLEDKKEMEDHLLLCLHCRKQLAMYKTIFSELKTDSGISFPPNFAQSVIRRIEGVRERRIDLIESGLSAAAVLVGMGLTLYYVNWKPVSEFLVEGYRNSLDYFGGLSLLPHLPANWVGANTSLLFFAGLILILVGWLDNVLSRHKMSLK